MRVIEQDMKNAFAHLREQNNREIYFFKNKLYNLVSALGYIGLIDPVEITFCSRYGEQSSQGYHEH